MTRATRHPFLPWAFHLHGWRSCPAHSRGSEEPRLSTEYAEPSELVCTRPLGRPLRTSSSTAPVFSHRTSTPTEDALPCEPPFTAPVWPQEAKWCACRAWSAGLAVSILEGGAGIRSLAALLTAAPPRGQQAVVSGLVSFSSSRQCAVRLVPPKQVIPSRRRLLTPWQCVRAARALRSVSGSPGAWSASGLKAAASASPALAHPP